MISLDVSLTLQGEQGPFAWQVQGEIAKQAFLGVFGPSGVGKTTLLRVLAGLQKPEAGRLVVGEEVWYDAQACIFLPPQQRAVGYLSQELGLFPHMTLRENLRFALPKGTPSSRVEELLEVVELQSLARQKPEGLSGGQRQRAALARALARQPRLLLLDEPFSALDEGLRQRLRDYVLAVHRQYHLTTLLVTHDLADVFALCPEVWRLEGGQIAAKGRPDEVLTQKRLSGKFQFTGTVVALEPADVVVLLSVLVGPEVVKLVVTRQEAAGLAVGQRIVVASKAFNPIIQRLED